MGMVSRLVVQSEVTTTAMIRLQEIELRALEAMAGYGEDAFIRVFYEKLGAAYMREHERGLRQFLGAISAEVPAVLHRIDLARQAIAPTSPAPAAAG